jgi:hypothetical protein
MPGIKFFSYSKMINKVLKKPVKRRVVKKLLKRFMKYIRRPSNEFGFFVLPLHKKWYNLPVDIFLDDNGTWTNMGNKKIILFDPCGDTDYSLERAIPMTIEDEPEILAKNTTIKLSVSDIDLIKSFVKTYKTQIIQLTSYKSDKLRFFKLLKKDGFTKGSKNA